MYFLYCSSKMTSLSRILFDFPSLNHTHDSQTDALNKNQSPPSPLLYFIIFCLSFYKLLSLSLKATRKPRKKKKNHLSWQLKLGIWTCSSRSSSQTGTITLYISVPVLFSWWGVFFFLFSLWNPIFSDLGFDFLAEISWNSIREIPTCTIPRWILCCLRLQQCLKRFHLITNLLIAAIWVVQPRPSWTRLIVDSPMLSLSLISESVLEIQSMTSMLYQSVKKPTKSQACHLFSTRTLSSRFINNNQRSIASLPNM